jgi:hypothetical protein
MRVGGQGGGAENGRGRRGCGEWGNHCHYFSSFSFLRSTPFSPLLFTIIPSLPPASTIHVLLLPFSFYVLFPFSFPFSMMLTRRRHRGESEMKCFSSISIHCHDFPYTHLHIASCLPLPHIHCTTATSFVSFTFTCI